MITASLTGALTPLLLNRIVHAPAEADRGGAPHPFALAAAMRSRLTAAAKAGPVALVDLGADKIACAAVALDARGGAAREAAPGADAPPVDDPLSRLRMLGLGVVRSDGVENGAVTDLNAVGKAIRAAVNQAEREAGVRLFSAVARLTGEQPSSHPLGGEVGLSRQKVSAKDMAAAIAACHPPPLEEGRRVLDVAPVRWTVDGEPNIRAPLGFAGRRLGVDLHVLTVSESAVRNVAECLAAADLEVAGLVSGPLASGLGCLAAEERDDGAAVVDLGHGATGVGLFVRGAFVFADVVRLGGTQITRELVRAFDLPLAEAERLKRLEGSAFDLSAAAPPIDLARIAPGYKGGALSRAALAAEIRPRLEEMLSLARDRLARGGFGHLPRPRVVLTGGGAMLDGVARVAEEIFAAPVRVGAPILPAGAPATAAGPAFSSLAGLARLVVDPPSELPRSSPAPQGRGGVAGLFSWLKERW